MAETQLLTVSLTACPKCLSILKPYLDQYRYPPVDPNEVLHSKYYRVFLELHKNPQDRASILKQHRWPFSENATKAFFRMFLSKHEMFFHNYARTAKDSPLLRLYKDALIAEYPSVAQIDIFAEMPNDSVREIANKASYVYAAYSIAREILSGIKTISLALGALERERSHMG